MICNSNQGYKGGNRDYCNDFSVIFETASNFVIDFLRLVLGKMGVDRFTRPRWKIGIRYEFDLTAVLKGSGCS